jgi:[ribosomal protein S5]-alanine N-acetyltransferase
LKPFDTIIETERLILRPFTMDDIDPSFEINQDPEVTKYTNDGGVKTYQQVYDAIKNNVRGDYQTHGYGRFAVEHKRDKRFIGFSGLKNMEEWNAVDLGYRFHPDYWGQGLATESGVASLEFGFQTLGLKEISGFVLPEHAASSNVLKKLGMEYRDDLIEDGLEVHRYSIFNPELT